MADWLREEKQIHVEVGSIWDDLNNQVESYCYTVTAPIMYTIVSNLFTQLEESLTEKCMQQGVAEALKLLNRYNEQKHLKVTDDQVVIAYLKGYGDKDIYPATNTIFHSNIEKYAYQQGKQGDYIEEGLTEDDILILVRNQKTRRRKP